MPWIVPVKRSSLSKSTRFSAYVDILVAHLFTLQKHKKTAATLSSLPLSNAEEAQKSAENEAKEQHTEDEYEHKDNGADYLNDSPVNQGNSAGNEEIGENNKGSLSLVSNAPVQSDKNAAKRSSAKQSRRPTYRIVTKGFPYYELAYGYDLDNLQQKEWKYITEELPNIMPPALNNKTRIKWILAHFTQLALEEEQKDHNNSNNNNSNKNKAGKELDSEVSEEDNTANTAPNSPRQAPAAALVANPVAADNSKASKRRWPFRSKKSTEPAQNLPVAAAVTSSTSAVAAFLPPAKGNLPAISAPAKYSSGNNNSRPNTASSTTNPSSLAAVSAQDESLLSPQSYNPLFSPNISGVGANKGANLEDPELSDELFSQGEEELEDSEAAEEEIDEESDQTAQKSAELPAESKKVSTSGANNAGKQPDKIIERLQIVHNPAEEEELEEELSDGLEEHDYYGQTENSAGNYTNSGYNTGYPPDLLVNLAAERTAQCILKLQNQQNYSKLYNIAQNNPIQTQDGRYLVISDLRLGSPIVLRGTGLFIMLSLLVNFGLLLIRDASFSSFAAFLLLINVSLAALVLNGKPVTLAIHCRQENQQETQSNQPNQPSVARNQQTLQQNYSQNYSTSAGTGPILPNSGSPVLNSVNLPPNSANNAGKGPVLPGKRPSKSLAQPIVKLAPTEIKENAGQSASNANSSLENGLPLLDLSLSAANPATAVIPAANEVNIIENPAQKNINIAASSQTPAAKLNSVPSSNLFVPPLFLMSGSDSSMEIPALYKEFVAQNIKLAVGNTMKKNEGSAALPSTWSNIDGDTFSVRVGPNYKKNKAKAPSTVALYECVASDLYCCEQKIDNIGKLFDLPVQREANGDYSDSIWINYGVPELIIIQFQLPNYNPGMPWTKVEDGRSFAVLLYYKITPRALEQFKTAATPATRLFKQFCADLPSGSTENHGRFKAIPRVANSAECDLGSAMKGLLKTYNAKPFLTGPYAHSFIRGKNYLEIDIDVHRFCYMARKAAFQFLDSLKTMIIDVGFVVEGVTDEELPEQVLGCTRLAYFDPKGAVNIEAKLKDLQKERQHK
jgi:hypothetical protein